MIKRLPPELINKIAAGEVVERPASVVKELVENSLDAGARNITIEVTNGGTERIRITDDGCGMNLEDALAAVERHTTSKLAKFEDLYSLHTHGFRGEALASVSGVAKVSIETKTTDMPVGIRLENLKGDFHSQTAATLDGTSITIEDLFHNVPARKKFLKSDATEYNHILELFNQFAIFNFNIGWKLIHNERTVLQVQPVENWIERITSVLGSETAKEMIPVEALGTFSVRAYVGRPSLFRSNKKSQFIYVNGRSVQDYSISKAVMEAYESAAVKGSYPTFILSIELPPAEVDVNVHPRKTEVRFRQPNEVYRAVLHAVRATLRSEGILTTAPVADSFRGSSSYEPIDTSGFVFKPVTASQSAILPPLTFSSAADIVRSPSYKKLLDNSAPLSNRDSQIPERQNSWRLVGQIHNSYILAETPDGLMVIDQHAAAERLNFERFTAEYESGEKKLQGLLVPQTFNLGHREGEILDLAGAYLSKVGFEFESLGGGTIVVNSVPHGFDRLDIKQLLQGIIADLDTEEFDHLHKAEELRESVIRSASCRGAIMFNDALTTREMQRLIDDIAGLSPEKFTCCHGRPFMKEFLKSDFERLFHRR